MLGCGYCSLLLVRWMLASAKRCQQCAWVREADKGSFKPSLRTEAWLLERSRSLKRNLKLLPGATWKGPLVRERPCTAAFTQGRGCKSVQEEAELRELVTWCPAENNGLRDVFALCLTAKAHRPLRWWEMGVELHFTCTPELDSITHNVGLSGQALQCHRAFIKVLERYWG